MLTTAYATGHATTLLFPVTCAHCCRRRWCSWVDELAGVAHRIQGSSCLCHRSRFLTILDSSEPEAWVLFRAAYLLLF